MAANALQSHAREDSQGTVVHHRPQQTIPVVKKENEDEYQVSRSMLQARRDLDSDMMVRDVRSYLNGISRKTLELKHFDSRSTNWQKIVDQIWTPMK